MQKWDGAKRRREWLLCSLHYKLVPTSFHDSSSAQGASVSTLAAAAKGPFPARLCWCLPNPHHRHGRFPGSSCTPTAVLGVRAAPGTRQQRTGRVWGVSAITITTAHRVRPWRVFPARLSPGLSTPAAFWCLINDRRKYKINKKRFCPLMRCMQEGSGQNSRKWGLWRIAAAQDLIYSSYTPAFAATIRKRFYEWEYLYKRECNMEGR